MLAITLALMSQLPQPADAWQYIGSYDVPNVFHVFQPMKLVPQYYVDYHWERGGVPVTQDQNGVRVPTTYVPPTPAPMPFTQPPPYAPTPMPYAPPPPDAAAMRQRDSVEDLVSSLRRKYLTLEGIQCARY